MIKKGSVLVPISIIVVILVSGCTGIGGGSGGDGVVILDFKPDFSTIYSGEAIKLQLRAQNLGEIDAENVEVELAGIKLSDWGGSGIVFEKKNLGKIIPYDPSNPDVPGGVRTTEWVLGAPSLEKGLQWTYTPIAMLSYDYKTRATKSITIVEQDELRRITQQGGSLPSQPTVVTKGPIGIEIRTGNYVKTSSRFTQGRTYDIFPIYVKITNNGAGTGGTVVRDGFAGFVDDFDYPVEIKITPASGTSFAYSGAFGEDDCSTGTITVDLWQGREKEITCELQVDETPSYREEGLITIETGYRYQTRASTHVKVFGKKEGFGW
ncbi:MAG: hypothetical protein ISS36_00030 [Candidatus Aenigmarchaeota archaeon]|nr:hypothetical protein [Candidatus Aenigmarchaeota archaeon]